MAARTTPCGRYREQAIVEPQFIDKAGQTYSRIFISIAPPSFKLEEPQRAEEQTAYEVPTASCLPDFILRAGTPSRDPPAFSRDTGSREAPSWEPREYPPETPTHARESYRAGVRYPDFYPPLPRTPRTTRQSSRRNRKKRSHSPESVQTPTHGTCSPTPRNAKRRKIHRHARETPEHETPSAEQSPAQVATELLQNLHNEIARWYRVAGMIEARLELNQGLEDPRFVKDLREATGSVLPAGQTSFLDGYITEYSRSLEP